MKKLVLIISTLIVLSSCSSIEKDAYKPYFENATFNLDSVTNTQGPTVNIAENIITFNNGIMRTTSITNPSNVFTSSYEVSHDTLYVGLYQSYKIIMANDNKVIYKYHNPISTGGHSWEYTYYLTRVYEPVMTYTETHAAK